MTEEQLTEKLRYLEGEIRRLKARKPKRWLGLSLLLMMIAIAGLLLLTAGSVTKPYTFSAGTTISASQVNSNFDTLYTLVSGNIDSANLSSDAASLAKVSGGLMTANGTNIGIGTASPSSKLDVAGTIKMTGFSLSTSPSTGHVLTSDASGTGSWQAPAASSYWAYNSGDLYYTGGQVGIGTTSPTSPLHILSSLAPQLLIENPGGDTQITLSGTRSWIELRESGAVVGSISGTESSFLTKLRIGTAVTQSQKLYVAGDIYATGSITQGSSRKYKENIRELNEDEALLAFNQLIPVKFNYRDYRDEENLGFVAEDVPELLATRDRTGATDMDYIAVLVKVVQEQEKKLEELESKLRTMQTDLSFLIGGGPQ